MEQKVFSKFNVYDQIGYLMVGSIAIFVFIFNINCFYGYYIPVFNLENSLIWLVAAYFAGHLLQGMANLISDIPLLHYLIHEDKVNFDEKERVVLKQARNYFGLDKQDDNEIWNICYMFASAKDITGQVQSFNAYYSLYRGWFVIFVLESLFLFGHLAVSFSYQKLYLLLLSIFLSLIFYRRSRRFWKYTRAKVLETFVIVKILKL